MARVELWVGMVDQEIFVDRLTEAIRNIHDAVMASPSWPADPDRFMAEQIADFLIHVAAHARGCGECRGES